MIGYILYIVIKYQDFYTMLSAVAIVFFYVSINVWAENTISFKNKLFMTCIAPFMYIFFYVLSFVEYVALIMSFFKLPQLKKSLAHNSCQWQHVERLG